MDEQSTTNIGPVFNCFLKTRGSCSLNEAAYPGVNLMNDLLGLLLFKTNKYVLLTDTRKAVLIIKLNSDNDEDRLFFFFWKKVINYFALGTLP